MKKRTRIAALFMAVLMMLSVLEGCGKSEAALDVDANMKKGEFYYYFIRSTGLYPLEYTEEEMEEADDYHIEAETLYDWYIIDEDDMKKLDDPVTRDIVAKACMRNLTFREEHTVDNIKDIDKCSDKQAVMDAVAYGLFTLENGYFNAKHAVSYKECDAAIAKMQSIDAQGHYPEREPEIVYQDNVFFIDPDAVLDYEEILEESAEPGSSNLIPESAGSMSVAYNGTRLLSNNQIPLPNNGWQAPVKSATMVISQKYFDDHRTMIYPSAIIPTQILAQAKAIDTGRTPIYAQFFRVLEIKENDPMNGRCTLIGQPATQQEAILSVSNDAFCSKTPQGSKINTSNVKKGVSVQQVAGGIKFSYKHTFELKEDKYKNPRSEWRNSKVTPEFYAEVTIDNFAVDVDKFSDLLWKREAEWKLKISYDTKTFLQLDSGPLRFAPANNGNGGLKWDPEHGASGNWFANIKNSRLTDADSKGSLGIKIMQINVPMAYGFSFNADLYLLVGFDGTLMVTLNNIGNYSGMKIVKSRKNGLKVQSISGRDEDRSTKKLEATINIDFAVSLEPNIAWNGKKLIDLQAQLHIDISCLVQLAINGKKSQNLYLTTSDREDVARDNPGIEFCFNIALRVYPKVVWFSNSKRNDTSIVRDFLDFFNIDPPEKTFKDLLNKSWHFEDGKSVDKCTRTEVESEKIDSYDGVRQSDDGSIVLSSYKVVLSEGESTAISLMAVPFPPSLLSIYDTLDWLLSAPFSVDCDNGDVIKASYNQQSKTVCIDAKAAGSATVTFRYSRAAWKKDKASCAISVTVVEAKERAEMTAPYIIFPTDIPFYAAS